MTVGEKIKYRRKTIGITQNRLAELTGIHPVSIRKYETDKMIPGQEHLNRIADALSTSANALADTVDYKIRLETDGDVAGLLITLNKRGVIQLVGERDSTGRITDESFRIVLDEKLEKLFHIEYPEAENLTGTEELRITICPVYDTIKESLIKWEYNNYLYQTALELYGDDPDKETQKQLSELKTVVEQSELALTNRPFLFDGGIKPNPDY